MSAYQETMKVWGTYYLKESAYATAGTVDRQMILAPYTPIVPVVDRVTTFGATTGKEGADAVYARSTVYPCRLSFASLMADDMSFLLANALGTPSNGAADTSAYKHSFSAGTGRTLPSFTLEELLVAGTQKKYAGGLIQDLRIRYTEPAGWSAEANVLFATEAAGTGGSGITPMTTEPAAVAGLKKAYIGTALEGSYSGALGTADITSSAALQAGLREIEIGIVNFTSPTILFTGEYARPARAIRGPRGLSLSVVLELSDRTEIGYVSSLTEKALEFEWNSGVLAGAATQNYGWQFVYPDVSFRQVGPSWQEDNRLLGRFDCEVMEDGTNLRLYAETWNKQAAYAAAA